MAINSNKFFYPPRPGNGTGAFDNIVGFQVVDGGGLTSAVFDFTTSVTEKVNRTFSIGTFSEPINLEGLDINDLNESRRIQATQFRVYPNYDVSQVLNFSLYGSLAKTGIGHGTDIAVLLGLCGEDPVTFDVEKIDTTIATMNETHELNLNGERMLRFNPKEAVVFLKEESLPFHPNGMTFLVEYENGETLADTYYSIGGGFVVKEEKESLNLSAVQLPFPIDKSSDILHWCMKTGFSIAEVVMENELAWRSEAETKQGVLTATKTKAAKTRTTK